MEANDIDVKLLELESLMDKYMDISNIVYQRLDEIVQDFKGLLQEEYDKHEEASSFIPYDKLLLIQKTTHKYFQPMSKVPDLFSSLFHFVAGCQYFRDSHDYGKDLPKQAPKPKTEKQSVAGLVNNLTEEQKKLLRDMLKK